jgi:hypothetical protein
VLLILGASGVVGTAGDMPALMRPETPFALFLNRTLRSLLKVTPVSPRSTRGEQQASQGSGFYRLTKMRGPNTPQRTYGAELSL